MNRLPLGRQIMLAALYGGLADATILRLTVGSENTVKIMLSEDEAVSVVHN